MKLRNLLFFLSLILFASCKKDDAGSYTLHGIVTDGRNGNSIASTSVTLEKQVVNNNTFGGSYSMAAHSVTSGMGEYAMTFARENFASLRILTEKEHYIGRVLDIPISNLTVGGSTKRDITMYPEAFIEIHVQNVAPVDINDVLVFNFTNAEFDCACCSNQLRSFVGATDSVLQCMVYGDHWLKYRQEFAGPEADTVIYDSIFCPAFQTTTLGITY